MREKINMNREWWFIHEKIDVAQAVAGRGKRLIYPTHGMQ